MTSIIRNFPNLLTDTYEQGKFNKNDLIAVLQGITGFGAAIASKSPLDFINAALGLASSLSGKACLKTLQQYLGSVKKWLTFGENYKTLTDSSDLDFDQVAVSSVPEIMKVTGFRHAVTSALAMNIRLLICMITSEILNNNKNIYLHKARSIISYGALQCLNAKKKEY